MRILQVSCSYFPDMVGGTEEYVHTLSQGLLAKGHSVFVHYVGSFCERGGPSLRSREYLFENIPVYAIEKNTFGLHTAELYFDPAEKTRSSFKEYCNRIAPDIVHFHHFSPTDVIAQMQVAKDRGLPVLLTYHAPMMTCGRADMIYRGERSCRGIIEYKRCLVCTQARYGVPLFLAWAWSNVPVSVAVWLSTAIDRRGLSSRLATWLQLPYLSKKRIDMWKKGLSLVDHFVAVCQWAHDTLLENGIPAQKISVCRHGIQEVPRVKKKVRGDILRIGYLGRIHPAKGIEILLKAVQRLPRSLQIEVSLYGVVGPDAIDRAYYARLLKKYDKDNRIRWMGLLTAENKGKVLAGLDVVVIPSIFLETGPLVLLEAWAAGVVVVGSRLGGIAELIKEGLGGFLFDPGDVKGLANVLLRVSLQPGLLDGAASGIPAVRTAEQVTDEMVLLYQRLVQR